MADRRLRIIIVSFVDDNFGDNLIRTTFQALLEIALADHGVAADQIDISRMPLKQIDDQLLDSGDIIFFAGGGLFGLSYLGFHPHVDHITAVASRRGIPVVFSSMGLNNMSADSGSIDSISEILSRDCVKSISVRENLPLFERAAANTDLVVTQVADPAVWTRFVYGMSDVTPDGSLGINVVRGGLFVANQRDWGLTAEMNYLRRLAEIAEANGFESQFYTNGSLDDNNTLRYFARECDVPPHAIKLPQTTRDVVNAVASRSAIASIRMHSSIIAYSFRIPTVCLAWNDKVPHFYEAIGRSDRALAFEDWTAENAFAALQRAGVAPEDDVGYRAHLMSTYRFIHAAVSELLVGTTSPQSVPSSFDGIVAGMALRAETIHENEFDLRVKMEKAERAFLNRFIRLRENEELIRELRRRAERLEARVADLEQHASEQLGPAPE